MAFPKDKLTKAHEQKAHTETSVPHAQRAPWQEALDRHVTVPASRSSEAAEVFRGFAGSWAASYEMGLGASSQNDGAQAVPALQRKTNRLGQPGLPEVNFRPYDWGTHRFGPKGPSLLGHPISFEIVGPTLKSNLCDWQWQLTPGAGSTGDVISIDMEGADDVSARTPPGPAIQTYVQQYLAGATTLNHYYGFSDLTEFDGGLYMVVSMGGRDGELADPAGFGGPGDGLIGDPTGTRVGIQPLNPSAKFEIFRIIAMDDTLKSFTLDPIKRISDFFDITGTIPIIRGITLIRPKATRLVAVPGSGQVGAERTFAVVPPARALGDEYTPPFVLYNAFLGDAGQYDPWAGFTYGGPTTGGDLSSYHHRALLPIEDPKETAVGVQPDSFTTAPAPLILQTPDLSMPLESGFAPPEDTSFGRVARIHEVELIGDAVTWDGTTGDWQADPGFAWIMGYHEIVGESVVGGFASSLHLRRIPEVDPLTGVPFFTPPRALVTQYAPGVNDGIRYKMSFHDAVQSLWLDTHPSIDKISKARLTNLINPDWVDHSRSMKQNSADPVSTPWVPHAPDKAIFDTSYTGTGFTAEQNANPGNLMDLGFRMVLFPAKDRGAGHVVPDFSRPITSREVVLDPKLSGEEQWWDVDYSSGLVTLSHEPAQGGDLSPVGSRVVEPLEVSGPFAFTDNGISNDTITRAAGDWTVDGVQVGDRGTIINATDPSNNGDFTVVSVSPTVLEIDSSGFGKHNLTTDPADGTATVVFGDNRRREFVLFAACVPYSREAGQLGASVRVTGGRGEQGVACGANGVGANADVFSERRYWRLAGTNASPQVVTSGTHLSIDLLDLVNPTDIPVNGFIEIIQGLDPEGPPAFLDNDRHPVSTFGFEFQNNTHGGGGTVLESCFGGIGVQAITVDDDNPYIAVLRRDIMLPSSDTGDVGTSYAHDVTYGSASRATALRFKHAVLRKQIDGSVLIEGLEELAQQHQKLFDDILSSWVISGFEASGLGTDTVQFTEGVVLIEGVRSEMASSSIQFKGDGTYYCYLEPQGGDPACPAFNTQTGMPLPANNNVLVAIAVVEVGVLTELVDMRKVLQDIDLRDDILVGATTHHPTESAHPHFDELADAVKYACEVMQYRAAQAPSNDLHGDRYIRIKVVGPTNEDPNKLPITFTCDGIIIEGTAHRLDGTHFVGGSGVQNQQAVAWDADVPLFDLNGHNNLEFRDLVLEYRDTGQGPSTTMGRVAFTNWAGIESSCDNITIDQVSLINWVENLSGPPLNVAHAFIWFTEGDASNWKIRNCLAHCSDAGIFFGGSVARGNTTDTLTNIWIENNWLVGFWDPGDPYDDPAGGDGVQELTGLNPLGEPEPHGGIILVSSTGPDGIVVRGNRINTFAGVGIIDNGASNSLYEGNYISNMGDAGIWASCREMFYVNGGSECRIVNNVLSNVHDLGITGGGGLDNMASVAGAGWAEKRAIFTDNLLRSVVANNQADISNPLGTSDASLYVDEQYITAVGNNFAHSVTTTGRAGRFILGVTTVGGHVETGGINSVIDGNHITGSITGTALRTIVNGNFILDPGVSTGLSFGASNVVSNNIYMGVGDEAIVKVFDDTFFIGNEMPEGEIKISGDRLVFVGNLFDQIRYAATEPSGTADTVISGNRFNLALLAGPSQNLQQSTVVGNWGAIYIDGGSGQDSHRNVIAGNVMVVPAAPGTANFAIVGDTNLIVGNFIDGHITVGTATVPSFENILANNRVMTGFDTDIDITNWGAGIGNGEFFSSITVHGDDNALIGNICTKGCYFPTGSDRYIVSGNHFGVGGINDNGSSLLQGSDGVITGNHFRNGTAENVSLQISGDDGVCSNNYMDEGVLHLADAERWVVLGNRLDSGGRQGIVLDQTSHSCLVLGNSIFGTTAVGFNAINVDGDDPVIANNIIGTDGISVSSNSARPVIVGNRLLDGSNGDINCTGDEPVISNNRVRSIFILTGAVTNSVISGNLCIGKIRVEGPSAAITGNMVGSSSGVSLEILAAAHDCAIAGNWFSLGTVDINAVDATFTGNHLSGGDLQATGQRDIIVGNRIDGGDVVVGGPEATFSHNRTGLAKGSVTIQNSDCIVHGNYCFESLAFSANADRPSVSGNHCNTTLDLRNVLNYVAQGNIVTGDLLVNGGASATDVGVLMGNIADRITDTPGAAGGAIPTNGMVVLGNRVNLTIFGVSPGIDSVGANAANQIIDFNVEY